MSKRIRVEPEDSTDPQRSYNRHPVEDMEPVLPTVAEQVRGVCVIFVGEIMRLGMVDRDIVCRRILGEKWADIATAHRMESWQAAHIRCQRAVADRPAIRRYFESTTKQEQP